VIEEVVSAGKPVTRYCTLAITEMAEMWSGTMTMHAVSLTLMTEKAGSRRKLNTNASLLVAAERLQVRVHVLARIDVRRVL
jgi:hypothetical protein